jgi:radical SAM protein with 4Fe4S-binding SPASM domain
VYGRLWLANRRYSRRDDMARSPFPQYLQLQTINACQAACRMCPYPVFKDHFPRGRMDDVLFDRVLAEIASRPEVRAVIPMLQNEPLLDRRLFEKVARIKAATGSRVSVELVTNGALLTDDAVERIRESRLDVLDISLDAATRETYERVRVGLDYDAVMAGVERVIAARLPHTSVLVRLVRIRDNAHEVDAFVRRWRRRGVGVFVYTAHDRVGTVAGWDESFRLPERAVTRRQRLERLAARAVLGHCPVPFASASILHNGDLLMCVHDWGRKEVIGNVRDASIAELWNGERMREIRRLVRDRRYAELPACRDCSLWKDGWV